MRSAFFLTILVPLAVSCKKEKNSGPSGGGTGTVESPRVELTISGDGFSGTAIVINPMTGSGTAAYSTADDETVGILMANAQNQFQLLFDGNATGTFSCTGGVGPVGLGLRVNDQQYIHQTNTVIVTEYGPVGGWVRGTFSGTMLRANGPGAGTPVTITNGSFRFKRTADL